MRVVSLLQSTYAQQAKGTRTATPPTLAIVCLALCRLTAPIGDPTLPGIQSAPVCPATMIAQSGSGGSVALALVEEGVLPAPLPMLPSSIPPMVDALTRV